ncbi:2-methylcitrate dehydratase [mine drainage metagenome]|uniref:2-methylcitrate dehydratase n=1 Tax=mine drainage metagenome TaxID=410659 RepID=A0A1J5RRZ5_9ZZZZ
MDEIEVLARHVRGTDYASLPDDARYSSKLAVVDLIGVAIAGSTAPGCDAVLNTLGAWAGPRSSTVIAHDLSLPAIHAAFANSSFAHALDYDDTHELAQLHATAAIIPAALAVAEETGGVSGKDFTTAIALGVDVAARLSMALRSNMHDGWVPASLFAGFGAVAAVAKILDLSAEQTRNAFGIFYGQSSGNRQALLDGALAKRLQPAFAAMQAIYATNFAKAGITGAARVVGGKYGLAELYAGGKASREEITKELGQRFEISNMSFKMYPCCRGTHSAIEGALRIVKRESLDPDAVESVAVSVAPFTFDLVGSPFQIRDNPQVDAQFSIPYTVAVAIKRRAVGLSDFQPDVVVNDAEVRRLATKIVVRPDLHRFDSETDSPRTIVRLRCQDGREWVERVATLKGEPKNPLTVAECVEKYRSCTAFLPMRFSADKAQRLLEVLLDLERVADIRQVGLCLAA